MVLANPSHKRFLRDKYRLAMHTDHSNCCVHAYVCVGQYECMHVWFVVAFCYKKIAAQANGQANAVILA
jgi:hypothetical protein